MLLRVDLVEKLEDMIDDNVEAVKARKNELMMMNKNFGKRRGQNVVKGAGLVGGVNLAGIFGSAEML